LTTYDELIQIVVDASDEERIVLGKKALGDTIRVFIREGISKDDATVVVKSLIKLFVNADSNCTKKELELINKITECNFTLDSFGITEDEYKAHFVDYIIGVIDSFPYEDKKVACLFGLTILASDGKLTLEEQELFLRLCG